MGLAPLVETYEGDIPALSASAADITAIVAGAEWAGTVTGVTYTPDADIAGTATNYRSIALVNKGTDGSGSAIVARFDFDADANDGTAMDELALDLNATNVGVAVGSVLAASSFASNGTGLADPGGVIQVTVSRSDGAD